MNRSAALCALDEVHRHSRMTLRPAGGESYRLGMAFERITVNPALMGGVPTIRGLRIPVATVVSMLADGMTAEEICRDLPDLELQDVSEALRFAAESVRERQIPLRPSA